MTPFTHYLLMICALIGVAVAAGLGPTIELTAFVFGLPAVAMAIMADPTDIHAQ